MVDQYAQFVLHSEAKLTTNIQEIFLPVQSWLVGLSEFLSPSSLVDNVVPILGSTDMRLMGEMTFVLALLNILSSVTKWTLPQHRPYWWVREHNLDTIQIHQSPLTCDTTGGLPCAHSMTFTGLVYVLLVYGNVSAYARYLVVSLLSIPLWIARVYFGSHFLHQCICGSFVAVVAIDIMRRVQSDQNGQSAGVILMESWRKTIAIAAVATVGLFVIAMYFAMQYVGLDPHWSVRMAFKWCMDPQYLRHEASPIFIICRDLGFLLGVAVTTPFSQRLQQRLDPLKCIPAVVVIMAVNFYIRSQTPKMHGRFVFVAYEFARNAVHSMALRTIIPRLCSNKKKDKIK